MSEKGYYGKRPLWQWVLIYIIVGGILYGVIYYVVFAGKGGYGGTNNGSYSVPSNGSNYTPQGTQNTSPNRY